MVSTGKPIDADNHYYESLDAFTRYLDPAFRERGVKVLNDGKRVSLAIGGKINRFIPNPTFDPIIVPGCLDPLFRGAIPEGVDPRSLMQVEPLKPEYQNAAERLEILDRQGLDAVLMFPTLGCGVEEALRDDVDATMASLSAFNRWLEEDWGFNYEGRIISAPMLSLADPVAAAAEVDSLLKRGARVVHVRPAPVPAGNGRARSLGDPSHDPVWARLAEAGVPVAFHLGDSGYQRQFATAWGAPDGFGFSQSDPLGNVITLDRAIHDTVASMIVHGVFTRHPALRIASIENGSEWLFHLSKHLKKQANQMPWVFPDAPLDTIRNHVWVAPYFEEDMVKLAELVGVDRVLFGSDWPHGEGVAAPLDFVAELGGFDEAATQRIMRDNCLDLLGVS